LQNSFLEGATSCRKAILEETPLAEFNHARRPFLETPLAETQFNKTTLAENPYCCRKRHLLQ
jgi:hypothetical protein